MSKVKSTLQTQQRNLRPQRQNLNTSDYIGMTSYDSGQADYIE
jgi:hypothetical protein